MVLVTGALYELDTANRTLPLVRSIVTDIVSEFHDLRRASRAQRTLRADTYEDDVTLAKIRTLEGEMGEISQRIERYLRELDDLGLELRDLETGTIDFPSVILGEPAYLCWRLGEGDIAWWHPASTGLADRQPIPEEMQGALPFGS